MTSYSNKGQEQDFKFLRFDHIHFWVGNAVQAAAYYISRFGFQPHAYKGLETGSRSVMTQVVRQNNIIFAFSSTLQSNEESMGTHILRHGDGVKDVAFQVDDCKKVFDYAVAAGANVISPLEEHRDDDGSCVIATIEAGYKDTWHTFVERKSYRGPFLPGFVKVEDADPHILLVEPVELQYVDHCVANQPDGEMEQVVQWYVDKMAFHRFWSVDDEQLHTKYSSLRSVVVTDYDQRVKMPINEPASGLRKSQIQEFIDYYDGPGIQHIALFSSDIISSVTCLRKRGVSFLKVPPSYYEDLRARLGASAVEVKEEMETLQSLGILVDFDDEGYLLQIFTKPVQDRPTFFIEIIQRMKHEGFGAGNFKSLFEAIEREQLARGNL